MRPPDAHRRLRETTAEAHRRVEAQLGLLELDLTVERYRAVLGWFYGYYEPLEQGLAGAAVTGPPRGFSISRRAPRLERDLVSLGATRGDLAALPRCADLPTLATRAHVAGCLYVIEGASLGGQVITRSLGQRLGITPRSGGAFFAGEGPNTAARWRAVLGWLEQLAAEDACCDAVVASACETFATMERWFADRRRRP